jgi:hypothetical protein
MADNLSPKYKTQLAIKLESAITKEFSGFKRSNHYISQWHEIDDFGKENFPLVQYNDGDIKVAETLAKMDGYTLLKIAADLGIETPDFIPMIPTFRNEIKNHYANANTTFEKALKEVETHPDIAIGLANSTLESIIKEIFNDNRILSKPKEGKTLYDLTSELLKELQLFPDSTMPIEIKTIGSSLLSINGSIEKLRSTKTAFHGKAPDQGVVNDPIYAYFVINSVATVGMFLKSYYLKKFPKTK